MRYNYYICFIIMNCCRFMYDGVMGYMTPIYMSKVTPGYGV